VFIGAVALFWLIGSFWHKGSFGIS
jgi:hypothetical protein